MRRAEQVRVGRVRLLRAHPVAEAGAGQVLRHLLAAAELVDERRVEPRLVDAQARVGEQPVAVEALDVVALVRAAVAPDVDVVLAHRDDEHRAGDGAPERRRVEVGRAGRRDVERARLQRRDALGDERRAAVDEARRFGAVLQRAARNLVVVGLVGLAEVRGVRVRDRALRAHPVQRGAGVETAGERDADLLADGKILQDVRHELAWGRGPMSAHSSRLSSRRGRACRSRTRGRATRRNRQPQFRCRRTDDRASVSVPPSTVASRHALVRHRLRSEPGRSPQRRRPDQQGSLDALRLQGLGRPRRARREAR